MSFFARALPFLFEDQVAVAARYTPERLAQATRDEKQSLINYRRAPANALVSFVQDPDSDIRTLLAKRLGGLLPKIKSNDPQTAQVLLGAIRQLTEDSVTSVRVALSSALKDVAHLPPGLARLLADDAERAVAEPIIRYSLGLSDEDLLDLILQHPEDWQVLSIAQRRRLSEIVGDSLVGLGNSKAAEMLLANDAAKISVNALGLLGKNTGYALSLQKRNSLKRRLKREFAGLTERALYLFLRDKAQLDKKTTKDVMKKITARVEAQEDFSTTAPGDFSEEQIKDAIALGENTIALQAIAARARVGIDIARRMIVESGAPRSVIALCVRGGFSMGFAVLCQQRLAHLPPEKIIYPKNGTECPLTAEEIRWQWEFFGI